MSFSFQFLNVTQNILEEKNVSENFAFGKVTKGINIYGICKFKKCQAYQKEVIISLKGKETFKMANEINNLECPICNGIIRPYNIGFKFCEFLIEGKIIEDNEIKSFQISGESRNPNIIKKFDSNRCGMITFIELNIKVYIYF
jgi:hypothetical protein